MPKHSSTVAPRAIDVFCGCGGLTLGLKQAGFTVIGALDNDPLSVETYRKNHPEVQVWQQDIRDANILGMKRRLHLRKGQLDLLAGCPPCQGFSSMRTLNGARRVDDYRNDLVLEFLRFVEGFRPKAVMLENVPGLATDRRMKFFTRRVRKLGYSTDCKVLDAADYGVPQRRRRLVMLAAQGGKLSFPVPDAARMTVADAIRGLPAPGESGDAAHDVIENRSARIRALISRIPKDGGSRTDLPERAQLPCHRRCDGFKDVYGRMAWDKPAPTITGGCFNPSKGRFLHPEEDRAITLREAALLQTFPRSYLFPDCSSKSAVALMIGNALPPEFVRRHGVEIIKVLAGVR